MPRSLALEKLNPEDHQELQACLGYTVNPRLLWATQQSSVSMEFKGI